MAACSVVIGKCKKPWPLGTSETDFDALIFS